MLCFFLGEKLDLCCPPCLLSILDNILPSVLLTGRTPGGAETGVGIFPFHSWLCLSSVSWHTCFLRSGLKQTWSSRASERLQVPVPGLPPGVQSLLPVITYCDRGDGLAQWLERWTGDPKLEDSNPVRSTRIFFSFSESKRLS